MEIIRNLSKTISINLNKTEKYGDCLKVATKKASEISQQSEELK